MLRPGNFQSDHAIGMSPRPSLDIPGSGESNDKVPKLTESEQDETEEGFFEMFKYLSWSFIAVLVVANLLIGFNNFLEIILLDVYTNFFGEEPGVATEHMAIFAFPKSLMLFYGLMTDNIPIFGSHRKSWLVISMGVNILVVTVSTIATDSLNATQLTMLFVV